MLQGQADLTRYSVKYLRSKRLAQLGVSNSAKTQKLLINTQLRLLYHRSRSYKDILEYNLALCCLSIKSDMLPNLASPISLFQHRVKFYDGIFIKDWVLVFKITQLEISYDEAVL